MISTEQDHGLLQILQLLPMEGEFCSLARRHKQREAMPSIPELKQELEHRRRMMELFAKRPQTEGQLAEIIAHLSDPGMAHWDKVEVLALHEFFELKSFLYGYLALTAFIKKHRLGQLHPLPDLAGLFKLLDPEGNGLPVFRLSPLYSNKLQRLDEERLSCTQKLKGTHFRDLEKAKRTLKLPNLKEEFLLSRHQEELIQAVLNSKYFVVSAENMANLSFRLADSPAALKQKSGLQKLQDAIHAEEQQILKKLSTAVQAQLKELKLARSSAMELVWDYMLASFGGKHRCCIPEIYDPRIKYQGIRIKAGINLPIKLFLENQQRHFQALDMDFGNRTNLITGPNMGGKTTALKTIALFCACAARGIPVPASSALLPVFKHIYYNHDKGENSETLSSFGREVVAFNESLGHGEDTLFLLDEFAKGTNPEEGEALSLATIQYLQHKKYPLVAATHFSAPAKLPGIAHYSIRGIAEKDFARLEKLPMDNLQERLKLLSEAMDYALTKLPQGKEPPRCAIQVAELLGMPKDLLDSALQYRNLDK